MSLIMDGLLMAGTLFAGLYCWILARRVRDLKDLDNGLGGAIVTLTRQIELARATLEEAQSVARNNRAELTQLVGKSEKASGQLRLLLAAVEDANAPRLSSQRQNGSAGAPRPRQDAAPRAQALEAEREAPDADDPEAALPMVGRPERTLKPRFPLALKQRLRPVPLDELRRAADRPEPEPRQRQRAPQAVLTAPPELDDANHVPKPRMRITPETLLRRAHQPEAQSEPQSEDELLQVLNAIAAGGGR